MSKISQIIAREYITRVRKRVFIIMTILGPILFAALMVVPAWIATLEEREVKKIAVIEIDTFGKPVSDSAQGLRGVFKESTLLKFDYVRDITIEQAESLVYATDYFGALIIKYGAITSDRISVELIAKKQPNLGIESTIKNSLSEYMQYQKLKAYHVPQDILNNSRTKVELDIRRADEEGLKNQGNINILRVVGYLSSFLIYMFIFFFGAQVMRGVVEEKTNRIIEVIITSVKPFQLMMGKIIGIGLVGLTQFVAWVILSLFFVQVAQGYIYNKKIEQVQSEISAPPTNLFNENPTDQISTQNTFEKPQQQQIELDDFMKDIQKIDFAKILSWFILFFLAGYLLYAAMFAAIGAAVDSETDTQQFMLPVTIPLIASLLVMPSAITNPDGPVAFWFSIIPFTSPIVMMARIPFEIPNAQIFLSAAILVSTFIFMTWLSGKIYRTGILMYGKKATFKEIFKWIRYS